MSEPPRKVQPTTQQLLRDIDRGLTGDKIPVQDPAAAPLDTDDEAAGASPFPDEIGDARERESLGRAPDTRLAQGDQAPDRWKAPGTLMHVFVVALGLAVVMAVALLAGLWQM